VANYKRETAGTLAETGEKKKIFVLRVRTGNRRGSLTWRKRKVTRMMFSQEGEIKGCGLPEGETEGPR